MVERRVLKTENFQVLGSENSGIPDFELPGVLTFALKTSFEASAHAQEVLRTVELKTKWRLPRLSKKTPYSKMTICQRCQGEVRSII